MSRLSRPAVFLDRDGTLNTRPPPHSYVSSLDQFAWLDGAADGIALLAHAGYAAAVVSNQRGIARGLVKECVLREIEARIQTELASRECGIEAFRYCPHDLDELCACRKPAPGLLLDLARELDFDLGRSWMIGDSESDVLAGEAAGCMTVLLGAPSSSSQPNRFAGSLLEAAQLITAERA
jgi:D-glycero-D-manno-heptose 1,7-bisphosphate phosphatase